MMLNAEKWVRLAGVLSIHDDVAAGAGASAPPAPPAIQTKLITPSTQTTLTPASSTPIAAIPLATVRASPPPAP